MIMEITQECSGIRNFDGFNVGDMLLAVNGISFCAFPDSLDVAQWISAYRDMKTPRLVCFFRPSVNGEFAFLPANVLVNMTNIM